MTHTGARAYQIRQGPRALLEAVLPACVDLPPQRARQNLGQVLKTMLSSSQGVSDLEHLFSHRSSRTHRYPFKMHPVDELVRPVAADDCPGTRKPHDRVQHLLDKRLVRQTPPRI